jgi:hypothetical protein
MCLKNNPHSPNFQIIIVVVVVVVVVADGGEVIT